MTTPPLGDDSPRTLAAAFAFLDDYLPPADDFLAPGSGVDAQDSLFLQESEISTLLDAQSSDLSGWAAGDQFFGTNSGGDPAPPTTAQLVESTSISTNDGHAPDPLDSRTTPLAPPPLPPTTSNTAASPARPADRAKKARNYNPNRARDEQRKELARLREQVPRLEQVLARFKWKARRSKRAGSRALATRSSGSDNAWQEVAACRRELREQAELENARLRTIVERQIEIAKRMQEILQTRHRYQVSALVGGVLSLGLRPLARWSNVQLLRCC